MALATTRRLGGVVGFTIDGNAYDVVDDLVWRPSTPKRETAKGQTRVEGYTEMPNEGVIGGTLRDNAALSITNFSNLTNSVLVIQTASGKTIMGNGMWCVEFEEVKTKDGSFSFKFEGADVSEFTLTIA
jgi:hypothetical protein